MTCIIGLVEDEKIYMGADSAAVSGFEVQKVAHSKVFRLNGFLIGYTSSFRMGQLLQYQLKVEPQVCADDFEYMVASFAEATRKLLKEYGYATVQNNNEEGGTFLVGYRGAIYKVQSDFSVLEYTDKYAAVGCGRKYALAAMLALGALKPVLRIKTALEVAAHFSGGVCGPFTVLKMERNGKAQV